MRSWGSLFDIADHLTDPPEGGPVQMWGVGGAMAAIATGYGIGCCLAQRATTLNIGMRGFRPMARGLWLEITGVHAVTLGALLIGVGMFIHFHYFWGNHPGLFRYHEIGKYAAALAILVAALAYVFTMITTT